MNLLNFIISSKKKGYATNDDAEELKFEDGSKGFQIQSKTFKYIDRYYGFNPFSGSEKVFNLNDNLIWCMNYHGEILENYKQPKIVYSFLREAMSKIDEEYPFRGPKLLKSNNLTYENIQEGTVELFHGIERIFEHDTCIYQLHYHGGIIKENI